MGLEKLGIVQDGTQIPLRELVYSYLKEQLNVGAVVQDRGAEDQGAAAAGGAGAGGPV